MTTTPIDNGAAADFDKAAIKPDSRPLNHVEYPDGGPSLTYLWSTNSEPRLSGQSLYLGGEIGSDGKIYCIPGHARRVLVIDPETDEVYPVGPELFGKFKWLRGVRCGDVIYGLPCHADSVLRIHVPTGEITTLPIPYDEFYSPERAPGQRDMTWKYHGGNTSPIDGCIYAIPQSACHVLKIDPTTDTCSFVPSPEMKGRCKWYGGVVGKQDGAIYGIAHNSPSVIRIDPSNEDGNVVSLHGDFKGLHKWHGAAVAPNGTIVSVPANADTVLCVIPGPEPTLLQLESADIQTGRHRSDNKYKYLGAMTGTDGKVYCFPSGSERVLQVDAESRLVRAVGPNIFDEGMERLCQNKWQNGLTCVEDQCTYAIPLSAETVLKIDTSTNEPVITTWKLPAPYSGLAKWEGGVLADNGVMYCMPNNHKAVLRIAGTKNRLSKSLASLNKTTDLGETVEYEYRTGLATLRAAAHRVKYSLRHRKFDAKPRDRDGIETNTTFLPKSLCQSRILKFDTDKYDFQSAVISLLEQCDPNVVGSFEEDPDRRRLENLRVPVDSLKRKIHGGQCEDAQAYVSQAVAENAEFMELFDSFVMDYILPDLKRRLLEVGAIPDDPEGTEFYYQRPPTLRLQPGPARASVKAHHDAEYGHQNGELNFWLPLTDRKLTGVDLWCESVGMKGDYEPLKADVGEVISFHGSSCRHYVNANGSPHTRVSFDFRVGVENFFDPSWQMVGTTDDHGRRTVRL